MRVVSSKRVSLVKNFRDYFIKELSGSVSSDIEKVFSVDDNIMHCWFSINGDCLDIVVEVFNEQAGSDLGTRLYSINLFSQEEKERIKFPDENYVLGIVELLQSYNVSFEQLGSGLISDWLENDEGNIRCKLWISEDFKFLSITRKILNEEINISEEAILDKLGL